MSSRFGVIGTGALGGFYGAKLHAAGYDVTFVCRSDFDVLQKNGLSVRSIWGDFLCRPTDVLSLGTPPKAPFDYLLVATKVLPEIDYKQLLAPYVSERTVILLLQNGIHIEAPIQNAFPNALIISMLAFTCISRPAPGHVHHQDYGRVVMGDYPQGISSHTEQVSTCFITAGIPVKVSPSIQKDRWQKLIWNAPFNPMSVLGHHATTQDLLSEPFFVTAILNTMKEVQALAKADGFEISDVVIEKNIVDTQKMTPYKTSMLLDDEGHRPLEVEAILGNAVRFAEKHAIPVPSLVMLYTLLKLYKR